MRLSLLLALAACGTAPVTDVTDPALSGPIGHDSVDSGHDSGGNSGDTGQDSGDTAKDSGDTAKDSGDTAADSGDTAVDTGVDTADTAVDTGTSPVDSGDTGVDTGVDTAVDTGVDTGTSPVDSGDSGVDTAVDTGTSPVDTGTTPVDTASGGGVDTATLPVDTAAPVDTALPPADTASATDTAPPVDTGAVTPVDTDSGTVITPPSGGPDTADTAVDTARPDTARPDTALVDSGATPTDTGNILPGKGADTAETAALPPDTAVYSPDSCDTADTAGCGEVIRFVALGDAGTGDRRQTAVASAIEAVCLLDGCDFALYLGDNIYGSGPTDVTDVQWNTKFEIPYAGLGFQFYAVLGNHDYGGLYDTGTAAVEVAYTAYSSKWYMPSRYYTETIGDLTVLGLDTQSMQLGHGADQDAWIPGAEAGISTTWTIAIGHHPYVSNGPHGNAGEFDGNPGEGQPMKDFFDAYVCGFADVYLAGHDHALQWLERPSGCDTEMIVAGGGGAGTYPIVGSNPAYYEDSSNGFIWVELDGNQFTGVFYDSTGAELYRRTFTK